MLSACVETPFFYNVSMFHNPKRKQIILVRHAKALEASEFSGKDFDRPLSEKGEMSLKIIAKYLRLIGVKPNRIVSSPAMRTKQTAETVALEFKTEKIEYIPELYNRNATPKRDANALHLSVVQKTKKDAKVVVLVGHNPDLTNFASYLSGDAVPYLKKGSIVVLSVPDEHDWKNIQQGECTFVYYLTPQFIKMEELV